MKTLNRIYIVGISGSGKTYLAEKLSKKLSIKTYDLDRIVLEKDSFKKISEKRIKNKLKNLIIRKKWIVEGAYSSDWVIPIYKKADLVIILDAHPWIMKKRVLIRTIKRRLGIIKHPKKESLKDFIGLLRYIGEYRKTRLPIHRFLVKRHKKDFRILKNKREINNFLGDI